MDTARISTQLPIIMGLRIGVFILFIFVSSLATSLAALCTYSSRFDYSLPALKSMSMEYACSTWRLLLRPAESFSGEPSSRLITSGNIFLLVNLIILALLVTTHIQQHAPAAAVQRSSSRKKRQLQQTKRLHLDDHSWQAALAEKSKEINPSLVGSGETANSSEAFPTSPAYADWRPLPAASDESWKEDLRDPYQTQYGGEEMITTRVPATETHEGLYEASVALESLIPNVASMHETSTEHQESSIVDSHRANSSDAEQIVLEEDGRLRLVDGEGIDAAKTWNGGLTLAANEDTEESDAEKIVLQEDGRLRFVDRPLPVSGFSIRPLKSLSDTSYCPKVDNQDTNYEINCLNDGIQSLNANPSSFSEPINGSANPDHSSDAALGDDAATYSNESSTAAASKRPIRMKKADSMDTTWKAINQNKGNIMVNATHRNKDKKPLIRQSSRQGFKPNTRGLVRDSHGNINSSGKGRSSGAVRREPSIGQEELNAKVESFIARFNEQIRIQRQDSILSFMEMVDRGA